MNDQENQYSPPQPGQSVGPAPQPQNPPAPQQQPPAAGYPMQNPNPAQQQPVQQPPQPAYQQPQQMYQQPQPQYQPQQPVQQYSQQQGPNIKRLALFAGGFLLLAVALTALGALLFGNSSLPLTRVDDSELDFSVSVPEGWETNIIDVESINIVNASPSDAAQSDNTTVSIARTITQADDSKARFIEQTESTITERQTDEYQELFNIAIGNFTSEQYGSDDLPAYRVTQNYQDTTSGLDYKSETYFIYESETSTVNASFVYSDAYSALSGSISNILASYQLNE